MKNVKPIDQCQAILSEMEAVITRVDPEQVDRMVDAILQAPISLLLEPGVLC